MSGFWEHLRGRYTPKHINDAAIMCIGYIILFATIFPVHNWNALTKSLLTPSICFILFCALCPSSAGISIFTIILVFFASVIMAISYTIITYLTFAAAGTEPSTAKAVAMVTFSSLFIFFIHLLRNSKPTLCGIAGKVAEIGVTTTLYVVYFTNTEPAYGLDILGSIIAFFFIAIGTGALVTWVLLPTSWSSTGADARKALGKLLIMIGGLYEGAGQVVAAAAECEDATYGKIPGVFKELESVTVPLYETNIKAAALGGGAGLLITVSALEYNIFSKPHINPRKAYAEILALSKVLQRLSLHMTESVQSGSTSMRAVRAVVPSLQRVMTAIADALNAAGSVLIAAESVYICKSSSSCCAAGGKIEASSVQSISIYAEALNSKVREVEAACVGFFDWMDAQDSSWEESYNLTEISDLIVYAAARLRTLYRKLPGAIQTADPEAANAAEAYFASRPAVWWRSDSNPKSNGGSSAAHPGEQKIFKDTAEKEESKKMEEESEVGTAIIQHGGKIVSVVQRAMHALRESAVQFTRTTTSEIGRTTEPQQQSQPQTASPPELQTFTWKGTRFERFAFNFSTSTGIRRWHLVIAIQTLIVYIAAAIINVVPASYNALGGQAYWIMISIFVVSDLTAGNILGNSVQRLAGCLIGVTCSAAMMGIAIGINGGSSSNTPAKLVPLAVIVTFYLTIAKAEKSRADPRLSIFFTQIMLSPLILVVAESDVENWSHFGYRVACVAIGVSLQSIISTIVFPLTTRVHVRGLTADALDDITLATKAVFSLMAGDGTSDCAEKSKLIEDAEKNGLAALNKLDEILSLHRPGELDKAPLGQGIYNAAKTRLSSSGNHWDERFQPIGAHRLYIAYMLRSYLSSLSVAVMFQQQYQDVGAWEMPVEWQKSVKLAGEQIGESLQALRMTFYGHVPYKEAVKVLHAVNSFKRYLATEIAAINAQNESVGVSIACASTVANVFSLYRKLDRVYSTCNDAFVLEYSSGKFSRTDTAALERRKDGQDAQVLEEQEQDLALEKCAVAAAACVPSLGIDGDSADDQNEDHPLHHVMVDG